MTEEEKKEAQLKTDYQHTQELFGLSKSLDEMSLKTKEEYQDFIARFYARVNVYSVINNLFNFLFFLYIFSKGTPLYVDFLDDLFKTLCKGCKR